MTRIEGLIKNFYKDSLLDEGRDQVRDTFSEVTTMLDAIVDDLGQDRVALTTSKGEVSASGQATGKHRVSKVEVMPFQDIKDQIDSNYNEIQSRTARIVVDKLGLGRGIIDTTSTAAQTMGELVDISEY